MKSFSEYFCAVIYILILINVILCPVVNGREPPVVEISDQGKISGFYMKMFRVQRVIAYLGIPYAQPPIDQLRFSPPFAETLPKWDGIRNGSVMQNECWSDLRRPLKQHDEFFLKMLGVDVKSKDSSRFSEDCLYLNVFTPDDPPPKDGYAVIVWLHSGDFSRGNASELNPFQMVFKQKVIIVTFTYRLGILGFFTTNDGEAPGNFGLMDQSAALRWVKRNIKQFNGNPDSITLMGHGAGAVAATLHIYSGVWAEENFHRVIIMSGTFLSPMMVRDPASYKSALSELAMNYGCFRRPTSALLACLRRVEASLLIMNSPMIDWMPVVDEGLSNETAMFIPDEPIGLLTNPPSYVRKIPIIIGYTDMEDVLDVTTGEMLTEGFSNEMYETLTKDIVLNELEILQSDNDSTCIDGSTFNNQPVLEAFNFVYKPFPPVNDENTLRRKYVQFSTERSFASPAFALAAAHSRNAEVFMYRFDIKPKTQSVSDILPVWGGVPHGFDLIYTWGMPYWLSLENDTQWVSEDKRISDIIMTMWANFAKFSNPTEWGVYINWTNFTANNQRALIIDRAFNMSDDTSINYHGIQFWNDYYPKVINFAMQCCNVTNAATSTRNVWNLNICSNSMHVIFLSFLTILLTFNGLRLYS